MSPKKRGTGTPPPHKQGKGYWKKGVQERRDERKKKKKKASR